MKVAYLVHSLQEYCHEARPKLFSENKKRFSPLKIYPSVNGYKPLEVASTFIDIWNTGLRYNHQTFRMRGFGAFSCYLSKYLAIRDFMRGKEYKDCSYLCLLEDDVVIPKKFNVYVERLCEYLNENKNSKFLLMGSWGEGYLLHRSICAKVLDWMRDMCEPVDHRLTHCPLSMHVRQTKIDFTLDTFEDLCKQVRAVSSTDHQKAHNNNQEARPFKVGALPNMLLSSSGNHGDIKQTGLLLHFSEAFDDPNSHAGKLLRQILFMYKEELEGVPHVNKPNKIPG